MKVQENITLYSCDFCKKRMVRKHAMIKHEPSCYSNPENKPACSDCKFLEEIKVEYYYDFGMGKSRAEVKGFKCNKLEQIMYPFKVVKKGLLEKYPETFEGQIQMPKECEHFNNNYF